ncbi:hypothetical protein D3C85_638430 [compost metagenome]
MSKRFGRNQRRKAREALAEAYKEVQRLGGVLTLQRAELASQERLLRHVRAALSVHERQMTACRKVLGDSIALPPVDRLVESSYFRQLVEQGERVPRPQPFELDLSPMSFESEMMSMVSKIETDTIDAIEGGIELDGGGALRRQPHAYLTTKQGAILYRVNLESLAMIHRPEAIARVAELLSREFIDTLQRCGPDRMRRAR